MKNGVKILTLVIITLLLTTSVIAPAPPFNFAIPDDQPVLDAVQGIEVDSSGNMYAVSINTREIIEIDSTGNVIVIFGGTGTGTDGLFTNLRDVAVDSTGKIFVTGDNQVVRFSSAGVFEKWWGKCTSGTDCDIPNSRAKNTGCTLSTCACGGSCKVGANGVGSLDGQFNGQGYLTFDSSDNLYVTDPANHRVHVYDSTMTFQFDFGTSGTGDGQFNTPAGIGVKNSNGNIYVVDSGNRRVQKFDSTGLFLDKVGTLGTGDGQFNGPTGLSVDQSNEDVYAADSNNNRIQRFDSLLDFQGCIGGGVAGEQAPCTTFTSGSANNQFNSPQDIKIDSGNAYVTDINNNRIQKSNAGNFLQKYGISGTGDGQFNGPKDVAIDDSANMIYVVDEGNSRIQKFNTAGVFQLKWGTPGSGNGQFSFPISATVDSGGNVYVSDAGNVRMQKFDSTGAYLAQGDNSGGLCSPRGIAFNSVTNRIALADDCNADITIYDTGLVFQSSFTNSLSCPTGITTDTAGNYYITDNCNSKVYKTNSAGTPIFDFGTFGTSPGNLNDPVDIYVDSATGDIYVVDTVNGVMVYDSTGTFLYFLDTLNTGDRSIKTGQFNEPYGIALGSPTYVADFGSDQVDQFEEAPASVPEFSDFALLIAALVGLGVIFTTRKIK